MALQRLVPVAARDRTALDIVLSRLLLVVEPSRVDDLERLTHMITDLESPT